MLKRPVGVKFDTIEETYAFRCVGDMAVPLPKLSCPECGATAQATCACGVPYVPASVKAAAAIAQNPGKSDRAIAASIGVSHPTVAKARSALARKTTGKCLPVDGARTGLDGRARRVPQQSAPKPASRAVALQRAALDLRDRISKSSSEAWTADERAMLADAFRHLGAVCARMADDFANRAAEEKVH
jgi:hypothetical protein